MTLLSVKVSSKLTIKVRRIFSVLHRVTPCGPALASTMRAGESSSSSPGGCKQSSKAVPWDATACYAQKDSFANNSKYCRRSMENEADPKHPARGILRAAVRSSRRASEPAKQHKTWTVWYVQMNRIANIPKCCQVLMDDGGEFVKHTLMVKAPVLAESI